MRKEDDTRMGRKEIIAKVKSLNLGKEQRNSVVCSIIGHSKIVSLCFGYVSCGRCEKQIGDRLGGIFDVTEHVIIGHNCQKCRENFKALTWKDKLYVKDPFKRE